MELNIKISNIKETHAAAIEDLLATWVSLGNLGGSRWTSFFADGDGDFRPKITVDGKPAKYSEYVDRKKVWKGRDYKIDFDSIRIPKKPVKKP